MKWLTIFDIIPSWVYAAVVAVLLLGIAGQQVRVANAKAELAEARLASEKKDREIADMRTKHESELRALQAQHAKTQKEITDAYDEKLAANAAALATERARNERLREPAKRYTTITPATGQSAVDAATIQSAQGRLTALGELLEEARGLVVEAGEIVRERDSQIELLRGIVVNDRAKCSAVSALRQRSPLDPEWISVVDRYGGHAALADQD